MKFLVSTQGKGRKTGCYLATESLKGEVCRVWGCVVGRVWAGLGTAAGRAATPTALLASLGLLQWHRWPKLGSQETWQLGLLLTWGWQWQGSTCSRDTLVGCPGHPFSTADFCGSLSDVPEGNWGTVKTVVSHWLYKAESNSWAVFFVGWEWLFPWSRKEKSYKVCSWL